MVIKDEGGLRDHDIHWVREINTSDGTPMPPGESESPEYALYSDNVRSVEWEPSPNTESQRGIGDPDPKNHFRGPEEHQITVVYDMQEFSVDGANQPLGAEHDGLTRDSANNQLPYTHTFVDVEYKGSIAAQETWNGGFSVNTRTFTVGIGGFIDTVTITGDPGSQQPVTVEITYEFEKVRTYQIDQPDADTTVEVVSTSDDDTGFSAIIESDGYSSGGVSESVSLNGTTSATTTATYQNVAGIWLTGEPEGDITFSYTSGGAHTATTIYGKNTYSGEGDQGIPPVTDGSKATSIGKDYEQFLGDDIFAGTADPPTGALAMDINSFAIECSNAVERTVRHDKLRQRCHAGERTLNVTATVLGETESHEQIADSLTASEYNLLWVLTQGDYNLNNAVLTEPPSRTVEASQATMALDCTFEAKGIDIETNVT